MYKATLSIIFLVFIIGAIFGMKKYAILGSRWGKILIGLLFLHHLMTVYLFGIFIKTWDEFTYGFIVYFIIMISILFGFFMILVHQLKKKETSISHTEHFLFGMTITGIVFMTYVQLSNLLLIPGDASVTYNAYLNAYYFKYGYVPVVLPLLVILILKRIFQGKDTKQVRNIATTRARLFEVGVMPILAILIALPIITLDFNIIRYMVRYPIENSLFYTLPIVYLIVLFAYFFYIKKSFFMVKTLIFASIFLLLIQIFDISEANRYLGLTGITRIKDYFFPNDGGADFTNLQYLLTQFIPKFAHLLLATLLYYFQAKRTVI